MPCARIFLACLLPLLAACGSGERVERLVLGQDVQPGASMTAAERELALEVFRQTNDVRVAQGLAPLLWSEPASQVAYEHAIDMRIRDFYAHTNPDGLEPCDRLGQAGVPMDVCIGENVARGEDTPALAITAWLGSDTHRALLLTPIVTHLGVGVHAGAGGPWWVQEFFYVASE